MFDLEDKNKQLQKEGFFSSFLKGKTGDEEAKLRRDLEVAREELESKIFENENVHMQMFELKQAHDVAALKLREQVVDLQSNMKQRYIILRYNHII